jgi:hypothetical protein
LADLAPNFGDASDGTRARKAATMQRYVYIPLTLSELNSSILGKTGFYSYLYSALGEK